MHPSCVLVSCVNLFPPSLHRVLAISGSVPRLHRYNGFVRLPVAFGLASVALAFPYRMPRQFLFLVLSLALSSAGFGWVLFKGIPQTSSLDTELLALPGSWRSSLVTCHWQTPRWSANVLRDEVRDAAFPTNEGGRLLRLDALP